MRLGVDVVESTIRSFLAIPTMMEAAWLDRLIGMIHDVREIGLTKL